MSVYYSPGRFHFEKQAIATLDQNPPVQNTWYTILETTYYVRLLYIAVKHDNTDNVAKNLEVRVTIDGVTLAATAALAPGDNTWCYWYLEFWQDSMTGTATLRNVGYYEGMRGHTVLVECRMTSVPGTAEELDGRVQYEMLEPSEW